MAMYKNTNQAALLTGIEFSPVADGNFAFFYTRPGSSKDELKQRLASAEVGQEIIAETLVDGQAVLVTHGDKSKEDLLKLFETTSEQFKPYQPAKKFNPWAWRGHMSNVGQVLQLTSAAMKPKGIDVPTATFAISNLLANLTNVVFGGEVHKDINGERHIKGQMNKGLSTYLAGEEPLPDVEDQRLKLRKDIEPPKSVGEQAYNVMQQNSVKIGEIGLRYFGAANMAFPMFEKAKWSQAFKALGSGSFKEAFTKVKNPDKASFYVGVAYLIGKTVALFSKIPDPYDTTPKTAIDEFREKYAFRLSSIIEGSAAGILSYDRFKKDIQPGKVLSKVGIKSFGDKKYPDVFGGVGGLLFMGGFGIRLFAPFGTKKLDVDEVLAHATDSLAKTPPEKLPQLMAESAAMLKEHVKNDNIGYGEIFTRMMNDMYQYHHIALDNLGTEPQERNAKMLAKCMQGIPPEQRNERTMAQCLDGTATPAATPAATTTGAPAASDSNTSDVLTKCLDGIPPEQRNGRSLLQCLDGVAAAQTPESMAAKHANAPRRASERVAAPASTYADKTAKSSETPTIPQVGV